MPIRQTLVELQSQGLVAIPPNRDASVRIVDEALANNLCDLRKAILSLVVRLFVERATAAQIHSLEKLENDIDVAASIEQHMIANDLFFTHVMTIAGNSEAADALNRTWPLLCPATRHFGPRDRRANSCNHRAIIAAAQRRDANTAVKLALQAAHCVNISLGRSARKRLMRRPRVTCSDS